MPKVDCYCVVCGKFIGKFYPSKLKKTCSAICFKILFSKKYLEKYGVLRICRVCGKTAKTKDELEKFVVDPRIYIGRTSLCKKCYNVRQNEDYHFKFKEKRKLKQRQYRRNLRIKTMIYLSDGKLECKVCGFKDVRALQIDHIYGGGRAEVRKLGKATAVYRKILKMQREKAKTQYQVLCANHNKIKQFEKEEWPKGNNPYKNFFQTDTNQTLPEHVFKKHKEIASI